MEHTLDALHLHQVTTSNGIERDMIEAVLSQWAISAFIDLASLSLQSATRSAL